MKYLKFEKSYFVADYSICDSQQHLLYHSIISILTFLQAFMQTFVGVTKTNRRNFHPRKDGDYSGFVFSEEWCQTAFLQFGYHSSENIWGVQRGETPRLWVSNRGERIPVGTRFSFGKSSVLYLLRPLTLERGCLTSDRHFSAAAEQADFVGCKPQKTRNLP